MGEIKDINKSNTLKVIGEIGKKNADVDKILLDIKKIDETLDNAELDKLITTIIQEFQKK